MSGRSIESPVMAFTSLQKVGQPQLRPGDVLVVIHDFDARSTDELTLRKSERVELIELDEGFGDGWYLGRHLNRGDTGLFPGVYTTRAPPLPGRFAQASDRTSFPPPASNVVNAPHSPISPSPAGYTHSESAPVTAARATSQYSPVTSQYSPAFGYDSPRASLPPSYSVHAPNVQRSIGQALGDNRGGEDSPVMNETLSVIDEHITDLSTPRQSLQPRRITREDSESDYSSKVDQQSYIAGPETDEEDNGKPTEAEVRKWDHKMTAQHLRSIGLDPKHCDIFEEQEITGDVLLDMDQGFLYMKEYDFGVMGRRLKTWHKVRDFQNEVKGGKSSRQATLSSIDGNSSIEDMGRSQGRLASNASLLPRIPSLSEKPGLNIRQSHQSPPTHDDAKFGVNTLPSPGSYSKAGFGSQTPPSPWRASMISDTASRPSAAMVRELSHSRRHSSIDVGKQPALKVTAAPNINHQKQPSLDRNWSLSASTMGMTASPTTLGTPKEETQTSGFSSPVVTNLDPEVDRGYFSGNEIENRKQRNILRKRDSGGGSAMHSRQASANNTAMKRHSRLASLDSVRDVGTSGVTPASKAYHTTGFKGRFRSSSTRESTPRQSAGSASPAVTNLEEPMSVKAQTRVVSTGSQPKSSVQSKARKLIGLRAASEAAPTTDKSTISHPEQRQDSSRASPVASPTGSTTPSGASHSMELEASEAPSKLNDIQGLTLPKAQARNKPKAKQETSAYQRGLLKLTPEEARQNCDYHGWMKKKSSSLMTTWKPRLFILRGRRLSYYYAETDTQERGIIDISGHKVLVANSDAMVTLHAQITGATSTASPTLATSSAEPSPILTKSPDPESGAPFYFKLVPPKSGMSRAVQFTKPTVHFFQVDSIAEGRKWMGEIMKATIEHDLASFETTNKQKTISLAKAQARRERPPALQEGPAEAEDVSEDNKENVQETGLNIQGLDFSDSQISLKLTGMMDEKGREDIRVQ